ncbi:N-acetylglucosamine-6-phosphate deacetylase [Aerococcus kribbianus]|uniref:N-acetylglucosamine-6-phosphate deacetylase n=1 Tax=Aerococcus kribbianus TaxID=2999064 RepID=A0A9X3FMS2_9LACT|nr:MULTISPECIES: N-acetylglucosamine-6-phosphate deacetylase [unclassified Aerococcus]MCZ0717129.1 N-acetylglucosamine-6-phosphate deacetylase [Aerococcus sp. YH-aer221]MCZ0725417.1 N-acetylglucosamine-6-phosphate deacetylase [Aerococcus sp. YH-aer222]
MTAIYADKFFLPDQETGPGYLTIEGQYFGEFSQTPPAEEEVINYSGYQIAPGYVDTHIHGYGGADVMDLNPQALETISKGIPANGVTSYLATTLTASKEDLDQACQLIGQYKDQLPGAKIAGIFLEGPFFSEKYKGAQNPAYMSDPQISDLADWQALSKGVVKKIAIAPERSGALEFIDYAKDQGIYVAIAHTDATFDQCQAAVDHGANIFVHEFNGMKGIHHREPGTAGAGLVLDNVFAEMICDGFHLHPAIAKLITKARGVNESVLITDCMRGGGIGEGESRLGEFPVYIKDGAARLKSDNHLAGSVLTLAKAVQNMVAWGIVSPAQAIKMASYVPAASVGLADQCGQIAPGRLADFIVLDKDLAVKATYINGQEFYQS